MVHAKQQPSSNKTKSYQHQWSPLRSRGKMQNDQKRISSASARFYRQHPTKSQLETNTYSKALDPGQKTTTSQKLVHSDSPQTHQNFHSSYCILIIQTTRKTLGALPEPQAGHLPLPLGSALLRIPSPRRLPSVPSFLKHLHLRRALQRASARAEESLPATQRRDRVSAKASSSESSSVASDDVTDVEAPLPPMACAPGGKSGKV